MSPARPRPVERRMRLRQEVVLGVGVAVLVRAAVHDGQLLAPVEVRRRRGGACHSSVLAFHGFIGALRPRKIAVTKLMAKRIWLNPRPMAPMVMMTFQCCWCCRNSYCMGL